MNRRHCWQIALHNQQLQGRGHLIAMSIVAGQGRWKEAVPLLEESQTALAAAFGEEYEALGEAEYYLTLAAVPRATEVGLADLETGLIAVGKHPPHQC